MSNSCINFKNLYNQYKEMVYNVALNYLQNIEDAKEVTQDVFIKVHNSFSGFNNNSSLKTWIYRITINKSLDFIKHKNSLKRFFIFGKKSNNNFELNNLPTFDHPGIALENKENTAILFAAINQLSANQKTAFILSKIDGLSNTEIAVIMNNSVSAVESLVFRAKEVLKTKLSIEFENYRKKKLK